MKKRHADVLSLIITGLDGGEMPDPLGDDGWRPGGHRVEERWLPAGALVIFDGSPIPHVLQDSTAQAGSPAGAQPPVSFAFGELEQLRAENHELRTQLHDRERDAEELREELEDARSRGGARRRRGLESGDPSITAEHIKRALREGGFTFHCQPV